MKKQFTKNDFMIVDIKELNCEAVNGYLCANSCRYHIVSVEDFNKEKQDILSGDSDVAALFSSNDKKHLLKHIDSVVSLLNSCWSVDCGCWQEFNDLDYDSDRFISIEVDEAVFMRGGEEVYRSTDLDYIINFYFTGE